MKFSTSIGVYPKEATYELSVTIECDRLLSVERFVATPEIAAIKYLVAELFPDRVTSIAVGAAVYSAPLRPASEISDEGALPRDTLFERTVSYSITISTGGFLSNEERLTDAERLEPEVIDCLQSFGHEYEGGYI